MEMWEQVISVVVSNGIFAVLFVGLFFYQLKDSHKREEKYQKTIEDLTGHLNVLEDVKKDVGDLKDIVLHRKEKKNEVKTTD